ncbi:hypothetical protein ACEN9X_02595 [Mucilaginibacter sp. Mucisp86]|uniref:hypothetical protein n=1 Tax=Mucilaginibacter sp. Mucisp86 TaxID=3243060 RepID=UPI0039B56153
MTKKYILKPGLHQFAPGSAAVHCNENLSDKEAEWYLQRYPHIEALFAPRPPEGGVAKQTKEQRQSTEDEMLGKGGSV